MKPIVIGLALIVLTVTIFAQETAREPEPYDPSEFPAWSRDLRRAEIISVGAFPIAMILSGFAYQIGRFAWYSADAGSAVMEYAPWFLSTSTGERYTNDERKGLIVAGVSVSLVVAAIDYLVGRRNDRTD